MGALGCSLPSLCVKTALIIILQGKAICSKGRDKDINQRKVYPSGRGVSSLIESSIDEDNIYFSRQIKALDALEEEVLSTPKTCMNI